MTVCVRAADCKLAIPEIGKNPRAQQVVAEVPEGAVLDGCVNACIRTGTVVVASVDCVAVRGHPPVLPDVRRGYADDREAVRGKNCGISHAAAGCGSQGAIRQPLLVGGIGLKIGDDVHRLEAAHVGGTREEGLVAHKRHNGEKLRRRAIIVLVGPGRGQDAEVSAGGVSEL